MNFLRFLISRRPPERTAAMQDRGLVWAWIGEEWREVCDFCGGNCGQCGLTSMIGNIPASMDRMIENLMGRKL